MTAASDRVELLELYKMSVEMADRLSARRGTANAFFLTVQSALAATVTLVGSAQEGLTSADAVVLATVGVVLSVAWLLQLRSYRDLNTAKFTVILELEKDLVAQPFADEWASLKRDPVRPWRERYAELGFSERLVPAIFVMLYVAIGWIGATR